MPLTYTNRKGVAYTLYQGKSAAGKVRYFFSRRDNGNPVDALPPGYRISESPNGVVSLVKDRPPLIRPEEIAAVERAVRKHPRPHNYRVVGKHNRIEIYAPTGSSTDNLRDLLSEFGMTGSRLEGELRRIEDRSHYAPVMRFTLLDKTKRTFGAERWCYRGSIDGWLTLHETGPGPVADLANKLAVTLDTDEFFELW